MGYNKYNAGFMPVESNINGLLMEGEQLLWSGKPKKNAFIINKSVTMMPFALLWFCFDGFFIGTFVKTGAANSMLWFIVPFFAFHLMPVWIWLYNMLSAGRRWQNTEYAVTDKRIMIRDGVVGYSYQNLYYTDINSVNLHVGVIDRMLGVGDIIIDSRIHVASGNNTRGPAILDIENPEEIFRQVQKTILDIQTDIHYPNAMRPGENPGFNTQYKP